MNENIPTNLPEHPPIPSPIETAPLKTKDIVHWLRKKQAPFGNALKEFAKKSNFMGFQSIESATGYAQYFKNRPRMPTHFKRPTKSNGGEFTGVGLCAVASGAIEEAMVQRYGEHITVVPYLIHTEDMDVDTGKSIEEGFPPHPHTILLFKAKTDPDWYLLDDTYRQFQIKVKPEKMIITPAKNIHKLYSVRQLLARARIYAPDTVERYTPQPRPQRYLHKKHLEEIQNKETGFENVTVDDYMKLLKSLK